MPRRRRARIEPPRRTAEDTGLADEELSALTIERPVQLLLELPTEDGTTVAEVQTMDQEPILEAQKLIKDADGKALGEQNHAVEQAVRRLYTYPPRSGQLKALQHLLYRRTDLILIAKTSFGKSMLLQATPLLSTKSMALVVLPLDQIGKEQSEYILKIGGRPCFLNSANFKDKKLLEEVRGGNFTHILLSPELAVSKVFRTIATDPIFYDKVGLIVVDEAHLVAKWGKGFRTDYARLHQLRAIFGKKVPWFACSATLDDPTLKIVIRDLGMPTGVTIQRNSINRPELVYQIAFIPNKAGSSALRFLFDVNENSPVLPQKEVPKTVVFFDTKKEAIAARDCCRQWLRYNCQPERGTPRQYTEKEAKATIQIYNRNTPDEDKEAILREFADPDSPLRALFSTEALALGIDLPTIVRAIQFRIVRNQEIATLLQRWGRASRHGQLGFAVLLLDEWMKGVQKKPAVIRRHQAEESIELNPVAEESEDEDIEREGESVGQKKTHRLTNSERRNKLPEIWYRMANPADDPHCIRKLILDHFNEPEEFRGDTQPERCCSICNPEYQIGDPTRYLYHEKGSKPNKGSAALIEAEIKKWAEELFFMVYPNSAFPLDASTILTEKERAKLAVEVLAKNIKDIGDLRGILGQWPFMDQYGSTLLRVLEDAYRKHRPSNQARAHTCPKGTYQFVESPQQCSTITNPTSSTHSRKKRKALDELSINQERAPKKGKKGKNNQTRPS